MTGLGHEHSSEAALGISAHCRTPDTGANGQDGGSVPQAEVRPMQFLTSTAMESGRNKTSLNHFVGLGEQ
jgi:hypothetical protein